ncbi:MULTISPECIES: VanW family protein [Xanthomonas translucens group]|uniref:VanW family protein n=1 Tax=Xanthomonas translucens group TaxID=3390202 RepID=UPI001E5696BF|nr:VanW family protein [Xanthomonas translucens]
MARVGGNVAAAGRRQDPQPAGGARALHWVEVPVGAAFSFWRQLGRATRRRGFAAGRELCEGCLVPSIGGGLCQLSNAIYDAALRQGLHIDERHRHTHVIAGSLAERDRDAVVFWHYVDLRRRAHTGSAAPGWWKRTGRNSPTTASAACSRAIGCWRCAGPALPCCRRQGCNAGDAVALRSQLLEALPAPC